MRRVQVISVAILTAGCLQGCVASAVGTVAGTVAGVTAKGVVGAAKVTAKGVGAAGRAITGHDDKDKDGPPPEH